MDKPLDGWTIVFDLDGTLVETAPDLLEALNHVLAIEGLAPVELDAIREMIGHGAKAMIRQGASSQSVDLSDKRIDTLWTEFISYYAAHIAIGSHAFEGVTDALLTLQNKGATLCVCTNKTQALSDQLLSALMLDGFFACIVGADSVPDRKPNGDHILRTITAAGGSNTHAIMVGDSRTDERAARNAELPFIFVPFGYEAESVDQIGADAVVTHFSDLVSTVLALVS